MERILEKLLDTSNLPKAQTIYIYKIIKVIIISEQ